MNKNDIVVAGIKNLLDGEINIEFYNLSYDIIAELSKDTNGNIDKDYCNVKTSDFLLSIQKDPSIIKLETPGKILEKIKNFLTRSKVPGSHELWSILSTALQALEKMGEVSRDPSSHGVNNNNETCWVKKGSEGEPKIDFEKVLRNKNQIVFSERIINSEHKKILSPRQAKEFILSTLTVANGWLTMQYIKIIANECVLVLRTESIDEDIVVENGETGSKHDIIGSSVANSAQLLFINEEVKMRSSRIWEKIGSTFNGRSPNKVGGYQFFCGYLIPKLSKKPKDFKGNLEDFGPTSTASDCLTSMKNIIYSYLSFDSGKDSYENEDSRYLVIKEIKNSVITDLSQRCSESGSCCSL